MTAVVLVALLAAGLGGTMAGCGGREPVGVPVPATTPTPSASAGLLLGKWEVRDGQLAKSTIQLGERVEFKADGTLTWGVKDGSYSVFRDQMLTLKWAFGETLDYDCTVEGDTLTLIRHTPCGKQDRYVLQRVE